MLTSCENSMVNFSHKKNVYVYIFVWTVLLTLKAYIFCPTRVHNPLHIHAHTQKIQISVNKTH